MDGQLQDSKILRSAYPDFTKSERHIAVFIATHRDRIGDFTVAGLAKDTNSSEITISRFCKKLGYSGLKELKIALLIELSAGEKGAYQHILAEDSTTLLAQKLFQNIIEGLQDTLQLIDYEAVDRACDLLLQARHIACFGFGNSATVCRDMETRYIRLGLSVKACADPHMQVTQATLMNASDIILVVSHSGASKELIESVKVGKQQGAKIILLTSRLQTPLAKLADVCLRGMGREVTFTTEAGASRFIHAALAEVLYVRMSMKQRHAFDESRDKIRSVIDDKRLV